VSFERNQPTRGVAPARLSILVVSLLALGATGCASAGAATAGAPLPTHRAEAKGDHLAAPSAPGEAVSAKQDGYRPGSQPCELDSVFFGFNEFEVTSSGESTLRQVVQCMRESGVRRIHVTGHTDNRGTEAYNIALGDRRARAVKAALIRLGVPARAISLSSAGEEWACGEDEAGWANDRRVDITAR
jgi:peptidoglycan-associated lipoprotein